MQNFDSSYFNKRNVKSVQSFALNHCFAALKCKVMFDWTVFSGRSLSRALRLEFLWRAFIKLKLSQLDTSNFGCFVSTHFSKFHDTWCSSWHCRFLLTQRLINTCRSILPEQMTLCRLTRRERVKFMWQPLVWRLDHHVVASSALHSNISSGSNHLNCRTDAFSRPIHQSRGNLSNQNATSGQALTISVK